MAKKEIKWGNKELPGLSFDELNKMTFKSLAASETGKNNVKSGHLQKIAPMGGKKTGDMMVANGHLESVRDINKMLKGATGYFKDRQDDRIILFNKRIEKEFGDASFSLNDLEYLHKDFSLYKNPRQEFRRILMNSGFYETAGKRTQSILYKKINK